MNFRSALPVLLSFLLLAGCGKKDEATPDSIKLAGDSTRAEALGAPVELQFTVTGKKSKTTLGGESVPVVAGARVDFKILSQPESGEASFETASVQTDAGGRAKALFRVGAAPGVYRISAALADHPQVSPATVSILGGVIITGDRQDGEVNGHLGSPIVVHLQSAPGKPFAGGEVALDIRKAAKGTKLSASKAVTDETGNASFDVMLGDKQGGGEVGVIVLKGAGFSQPEMVKVRFFAIDKITLLVQVFGGLAIFIFGMSLMSEGLSLVAGDKLRALLNLLTSNRFAAVGVGLLTTSLIQSSSACTVMVIGFVNAGLMQLEQAIGVIMGANIGTTVTAQMISFNLDQLAYPAIFLGVAISLLTRKRQVKFWAQILIGFGILFLGMGLMSEPLKQLKDSETIKGLFAGVSCAPTGGSVSLLLFLKAVAAGTILTVVVQSSSASIGLLIALAGAGLLDVYTSFAILLGDNIGTTITAVLAAIGSSKTAKRAALAHCLFNVIGTAIMVGLILVPWPDASGHPVFMELVARFTEGDPFAGENLPRFLANAHTLFNVSCTVLLIGFVNVFAAICRFAIRDDESSDRVPMSRRLLDPRLLATPAIAMQQAWAELELMLEQSRKASADSFHALLGDGGIDWDEIADSVRKREKETDQLQTAITDYVSEISMEILNENQSAMLPKLLHSVNDAERIGDHGVHLLRLAKRIRKRSLPFSADALRDMREMFATVERLFESCAATLELVRTCESRTLAEKANHQKHFDEALQLSRALKKQEGDFRKAHILRHESGSCDIRSGVVFLDVLLTLNRVGGHLLNIVEATMH
jgi:Na/Pi-cotransporter